MSFTIYDLAKPEGRNVSAEYPTESAPEGVGRYLSGTLGFEVLTRLIADELRLYGALLGAQQLRTTVAKVGLAGEERDPVCGMRIGPRQAPEYVYRGHPYHFCSESCREQFRATPGYFLRATSYRS